MRATFVTRNLPENTRRLASGAVASSRYAYVDIFRGLLIAHMALDHASLMFYAGRTAEELAATAAPVFDNIFQFLTRFLGVPVAPGFCFMAGFMVAMTSVSREQRGVSHAEVTRRLIMRGFVLIAVDAVLMGLPRALMGFYSFMVLSAIGVSIIALALLRDVPSKVLLPIALGILVLHPLIDVSGLPVWLQAIVYEPVRTGAFRSMYPVIPWFAIVLLGFVVGRHAHGREPPKSLWYAVAGIGFALFLVIRLSAGYGNTYAHSGVGTFEFWTFAKYPPDLAFLSWSFGCIFLMLALLSGVARKGAPAALRPLEIFGQVPFFFYVVHFYVLGIAQAIIGARTELPQTYAIWLLLLVVMILPCVWYSRMKRERPNFVTRYF
jgi:uncharacterized membrane protein